MTLRCVLSHGGLLAALLIAPRAGVAADRAPVKNPNELVSTTLTDALRSRLASKGALQPVTNATATAAGGPTQFKPSGGQMIVGDLIRALGHEGADYDVFKKAVDDALAEYETQAAENGLAHDIAGAMTLYVAAGSMAATGNEMTDPQSLTVARQLRAALDIPALRAASDREKQQLYEFLATFGLCIGATRHIAIEQKDDALLAKAKTAGGGALEWLFMASPASIRIDDNGLSVAAQPAVIPAAAPATVAASKPAAVPTTGNPAIVGIWRGIGTSRSTTAITNASGTGFSVFESSSRLRVREIAFFADGWWTVSVPEQGFAGLDRAAAAAREPFYWARYTFDGRQGTLHYADGSKNPFEVIDGKLIYDGYEFTSRRPIEQTRP